MALTGSRLSSIIIEIGGQEQTDWGDNGKGVAAIVDALHYSGEGGIIMTPDTNFVPIPFCLLLLGNSASWIADSDWSPAISVVE